MSPAPFQAAFDEFRSGSPKLFELDPVSECHCASCEDARKYLEVKMKKAFSVGFNAGVMAQAMKDAKEKNR